MQSKLNITENLNIFGGLFQVTVINNIKCFSTIIAFFNKNTISVNIVELLRSHLFTFLLYIFWSLVY